MVYFCHIGSVKIACRGSKCSGTADMYDWFSKHLTCKTYGIIRVAFGLGLVVRLRVWG